MTISKIIVPRDFQNPNAMMNFFNTIANRLKIINNVGELKLVNLADSNASNESLYFSTDSNKPVWKDVSGVVNDLY